MTRFKSCAGRRTLIAFGKVETAPAHGAAVCVVLASDGYPGAYAKGRPISGLEMPSDETLVFHAGTSVDGARTVTAGGRVLGVTGLGATVSEAREKAYLGAEQVRVPIGGVGEGVHRIEMKGDCTRDGKCSERAARAVDEGAAGAQHRTGWIQ